MAELVHADGAGATGDGSSLHERCLLGIATNDRASHGRGGRRSVDTERLRKRCALSTRGANPRPAGGR